MDAAHSILKKAPPADLEKNIKGLGELLNDNIDAKDALKKKYQLPFRVIDLDVEEEKPFLLCIQNKVFRVGELVGAFEGASVGERHDKYRSPWTNRMYHADGSRHGKRPLEETDLRLFEATMNEVWDSYKNVYYGTDAVGSVYLKDSEKSGFSFEGVFCIQKICAAGSWNSMHFVQVAEPNTKEKTCAYRVESSVLTVLSPSDNEQTAMDISASISQEVSKTCKVSLALLQASHIENIGEMIEATEIELRSSLERVHIPKTQEIMDDIKKIEQKIPAQANPLMGMIMGSSMMKKKKLQG